MSLYLTLTARDPIIARDGRPFGAGQGLRMKSLDWPYPSVLAGSLRTLLGKIHSPGSPFSQDLADRLKRIVVSGPLPLVQGELYFPAPRDLMVYKRDDGARAFIGLRPIDLRDGAGCNLRYGLRPVGVYHDAKLETYPAFWSCSMMSRWLREECIDVPPERATAGSGFLDRPDKDERMHVSIDPNSGSAMEGLLFKTVGLDISSGVNLAVRVDATEDWSNRLQGLDAFHPFGGERRLVHWKQEATEPWVCPEAIRAELQDAGPAGKGVRLVLATPALFRHGWYPEWLSPGNDELEGCPPGTSVRLRLVGACIDRWKPISGWSLESTNRLGPGPKALRRLVPAGSAYFFEIIDGDPGELAEKLWLCPVSDEEQDRRDGFGLALWGVWEGNERKRMNHG